MPTLTVRSPRDPFAVIEVRDRRYESVASGTGAVTAAVAEGTYSVIATGSGLEDERDVLVDGDTVVDLDLGNHASAAPTAGSSTIVAAHARATVDLSERLAASSWAAVGIVIRRTAASAGRPLPRWSDGSPLVSVGTGAGPVPLGWTGGDDFAMAGIEVEPGHLIATIGSSVTTSIVVPTWRGWQTLLFLPVTDDGIAASSAVMHVVPLDQPWRPELPLAEMFDHVHWALLDRVPLTEESVTSLRQRLALLPPSPLLHLMVAHLAATSDAPSARWQLGVSLNAVLLAGSDVVASDLAALQPSASRVTTAPLLARSADLLMEREAQSPGTIGGGIADLLAARWASPLWFEWSPAWVSHATHGPDAVTGDDWRRALAGAATALADPAVIEHTATAYGSDPATARMLAYLRDESSRRRMQPADLLATAHSRDVVTGAGLPAVAAVRAMQQIAGFGPTTTTDGRPPRRWLRRLLSIGIPIVALGGGAALLAPAATDPDVDGEVVIDTTVPSTDSTVAPTDAPTVPTDAPTTAPPDPTTTLAPNTAPVAESVSFRALADAELRGSIPVEDAEDDPLTAEVVQRAELGEVILEEDGTFSYFPPAERSGIEDSFAVVFSDGTDRSEPAVVRIEVLSRVALEVETPVGENEDVTVRVALLGSALSELELLVETDEGENPEASATPGEDFVEPEPSLMIPEGDKEAVFVIDVVDDEDERELAEEFVVRVAVVWDGAPQFVERTVTINPFDTVD